MTLPRADEPMTTVPELKGLVLAGGDSSRMGSDKAAANFGTHSLLARAMQAMQPVVAEVFVSARAEQAQAAGRSDYPLITDSLELRGPAAGILSAHLYDPAAAWLVLACDLPLVTTAVLQELVHGRAADKAATAWSYGKDGQAEPLCAVYEPATLAGFLREVKGGGKPSPQAWLSKQQVKLLQRPAGQVLAGANTPGELEELQQLEAERKQDE